MSKPLAMKMKPDERLYLYSMGKCFRVKAIFTEMDAANKHMERDPNAACIAAFGNPEDPRGEVIFIADKYDPGTKAPAPERNHDARTR